MSETMSSPRDHWGQFYSHHHHQPQNQMVPPKRPMFLSGGDDATPVVTSTTQNPFVPGNSSSTGGGSLSPEGRVSKPVRRRSRASRRTPTTLLNTDTANFRAMVQQYTGGPSAPFGSGPQINAPNFTFSLNPSQTHVNPSGVMLPAGFHLQYQQQQQQPSHPSYMFSLGNNNSSNNPPAGHADNMFLQRLGNPKPSSGINEATDHVLAMGGGASVSSEVVAAPPPPSPPPNENRGNTFLF